MKSVVQSTGEQIRVKQNITPSTGHAYRDFTNRGVKTDHVNLTVPFNNSLAIMAYGPNIVHRHMVPQGAIMHRVVPCTDAQYWGRYFLYCYLILYYLLHVVIA